jgi:hypothetical protein
MFEATSVGSFFSGATLIDFDYRRPLAALDPTRKAIAAGA